MASFLRGGSLAAAMLFCGGALAGAQPTAKPQLGAAVARGQTLFTQNCSACHGPTGRGGADVASDLSRSPIANGRDASGQPTSAALAAFLKVGRPERRMPAFGFTDAQADDLTAFLRTLFPPLAGGPNRSVINALVVGDARAGEAYFNGAGRCATCHSPTGDLKGIGARLPVAAVQGRLVMPRGMGGYARSFNSPPDPTEKPKTVKVTLPSGDTLTGSVLWITDFNVTFVDADGVRRTVARRGQTPKVEVTDPLQYHIDHMRVLTDEDMHDLTAYLVTLK